MMNVLIAVAFAYSLVYSEAGFVDTLKKCSIKDATCVKTLYQNVIRYAAKSGIPELDIPPVDPLELKNISLTLLDTVTVTVIDGSIKGISNCVIDDVQLDLEKRNARQEITCNLTVEGHLKWTGTNEVVQSLIGSSTSKSQGKTKVTFGNLQFKCKPPFILFKKDDGQIYATIGHNDVKLIFTVETAVFEVKEVFIGDKDISQLVTAYLNENSKLHMKNFGPILFGKAVDIYLILANQFFTSVPTNKYLIEDLSSYVNN